MNSQGQISRKQTWGHKRPNPKFTKARYASRRKESSKTQAHPSEVLSRNLVYADFMLGTQNQRLPC